VALRVVGLGATQVQQRLAQLPTVRRTALVREEAGGVTVRVFPGAGCKNGDLARSVAEAAGREGWKLEELHTEEGRLDEVFRNITMPDTAREVRK
jgi:ABC-2 type transport system ATP-binding protein